MRIITFVMAMLMTITTIKAQNMKENVDFNVWPKGEPNTAYAQYFIGNSYLAPPRCRQRRPRECHLRTPLPQQLAYPP